MDTKFPYCNPEIWAGMECSINRVGDKYFDQFQFAGLYKRKDLLHRVAGLGIKSLRFPVLWEYHEKLEGQAIDWTFAEESLQLFHEYQVKPIVGLVHHGSGPDFTSLEDPEWPRRLASYARQVAEKFPGIDHFTPVNEPLTTARFSGLYGFWYPHRHEDKAFARMLLNQVKGIVMAMQAIRQVTPHAVLVQTEDLGKTYSTPPLQYQALFENERRWLSYDLLCGKVDTDHALWEYLIRSGISEADLQFFLENPCPPQIMGFNYYITSERYLDDDIQKYPPHMHGGNWLERYVDTEAVRVPFDQPRGLKCLLQEAWERYEIPLALTEVHLNCTREEQVRWFQEAYQTACDLCAEGIPVKAVTCWSVLGAFGWDDLLRTPPGNYEPGVFDLGSPEGYETRLAALIRGLSSRKPIRHPILSAPGWWNRPIRYHDFLEAGFSENTKSASREQPILIIGRRGTLGNAFARICDLRGIRYILLGRNDFDLCNPARMKEVLQHYTPWAVINAAGFVRVDDAEREVDRCLADNTKGPALLAELCARQGVQLMNFSSDLVFDGSVGRPYVESDRPNPMNVYGQSKADMEKLVLELAPGSLVIRTSAFFGPWDQYNFAFAVIKSLKNGEPFQAMADCIVSPTYVPDLVNSSLNLLIDEQKGLWHLTNGDAISWYHWALSIAKRLGYPDNHILPVNSQQLMLPAARPAYAGMTSERGRFLPSFQHAMDRFMHAHINTSTQANVPLNQLLP